jgi:hypothetical protein
MDGWDYLDDDDYFLEEEEEPFDYKAPPKECFCPNAPFGTKVMCYSPRSQIEAHTIIRRAQTDEALHCCLFALAKNAYNLDASDLAQWIKECAAITPKPVAPHIPKKALPCGETPLCKKARNYSEVEDSDIVREMIERYQTLHGSLYLKLPGFDPQKLSILHAWAVENDPIQKGKPIRVQILAKRLKCSRTFIYNVINEARDINKYIIDKIEAERKDRAQITHGYTVDDR